MAKKPTWNIIEITEAIVRALEAKDLTIDIRTPFPVVGYIAEDKTLMLNAPKAESISALHLAHEIFHHYQNINGELPAIGSQEEAEYADFSAWLQKQPLPKKWLHYTYNHEAEAEVFAERVAHYKHKKGFYSSNELATELANIIHEAKLKNAAPEDKKQVEELQSEMNELHDEFIKSIGDRIDKILEIVLGGKFKQGEYSFKVK